MPWKPQGACTVPGCPGIAVRRGRCERHAQLAEVGYRRMDLRPGARERGYGSAWEEIRRRHLALEPSCVICGHPGQHVDHITPRAQGGTDDESNLQTLCASCHSRKTASQDGGFGNRVHP